MTRTLTLPFARPSPYSFGGYMQTSSVVCPLNVPAQLIRRQRSHHEHILSAAAIASDRAIAIATLHTAADVETKMFCA